ncbi:MAG: DUF167 domain-containing protein [Candidatus Falkowbacteria bacterium]|nr:DUF167 domain-containing protein [Candidatus Falkowbacteria bacterium]
MKVYKIKVITGAAKTEIFGYLADGTMKLKVAAIPEDGKANKVLTNFLAKEFGVKKDQIEIISGASSRTKLVRVND